MEEKIHFGHIIKKVLKDKRMPISEFAELMGSDRSNMYKILERSHLDSDFLFRASKVLNHDFFKDGSMWYQSNKYNKKVVDLTTNCGKFSYNNILKRIECYRPLQGEINY